MKPPPVHRWHFFTQGLQQAWHMILDRDPYLMHLVKITLEVAGLSTAVALAVGLPVGLALGLGRFRGRGTSLVIANAGLGLPPVVVGLVLALLLLPVGPLGGLDLLYTLRAVFIAQTVLAVPIVIALTASAVRDLPAGLLDQARAFGAGRFRVGLLALREARVGILAAAIAAVGSGLSEVGAITLVGGNIDGYDQTLASAALESVGAGDYARGLGIAILLMALILIVTAALTWLQHSRGGLLRGWGPS